MIDSNSVDFYRHREGQERAMASRTGNPDARRVHLDLADRYAQLIAQEHPESRPVSPTGVADTRGTVV